MAEKPASPGIAASDQGLTLGSSAPPNDPRFSPNSLRRLLPSRLLGTMVSLNPALNAPECVAAARAGKARGGRRIAPCKDEQGSQRGSCNSGAQRTHSEGEARKGRIANTRQDLSEGIERSAAAFRVNGQSASARASAAPPARRRRHRLAWPEQRPSLLFFVPANC
jgi:hypothetical protein